MSDLTAASLRLTADHMQARECHNIAAALRSEADRDCAGWWSPDALDAGIAYAPAPFSRVVVSA